MKKLLILFIIPLILLSACNKPKEDINNDNTNQTDTDQNDNKDNDDEIDWEDHIVWP